MQTNINFTLAESAIKKIEQVQQAQYDEQRQLNELIAAGNKLGLYDAVDTLKKLIKK